MSLASAQQRNQEATILAYNIGFGGLTAGIGAVINKSKGASISKAFLKGFYRGCFGGSLQYSGKKLTHLIVSQDSYWYAWPARITHSAGASIVESAALNRPFGQNWNMDFGPLRFDLSVGEKKGLRTRFNAWIISDIIIASQQGRLDWKKTLQTGCLAFCSDEWIKMPLFDTGGVSYTRSYVYSKKNGVEYGYTRNKEIIVHELIHIFQYKEALSINTWLNPFKTRLSPGVQNIVNNYIYLELPYHTGLYLLDGLHNLDNYYKNFYEFEAERLSTNNYINIQK